MPKSYSMYMIKNEKKNNEKPLTMRSIRLYACFIHRGIIFPQQLLLAFFFTGYIIYTVSLK